jgi:AraC-like DNA-binding protein
MTTELLGVFQMTPFVFFIAMQGILLYWYSVAMTQQKRKLMSAVNLIALVVFILHILALLMHEATSLLTSYSPVFLTFVYCTNFFMSYSIILGVIALRILKQHNHVIRQRFSNIDKIRLDWLWYCALGFVITWFFASLGHLLFALGEKELSSIVGTTFNLPPLVLMSFMVVFSQTHQLSPQSDHERGKTSSSDFAPDEHTIEHLHALMQDVKIYQDPDLRLDGLADSLGMPPRQVSALISRVHKTNFYDYVNTFRIKDAASQLRMSENADKPIQRVFEDAGFNSKSTFNTIFKKTLGLTPSQYRSKHLAVA